MIALVFKICLSNVYFNPVLSSPWPAIIKDLADVNWFISDTGKLRPSLPIKIATDLSPTLKSWSDVNVISYVQSDASLRIILSTWKTVATL